MSLNSFRKGDYVKIQLKNQEIYKGKVLSCDGAIIEIYNIETNEQLQKLSLILYETEIENICLLSKSMVSESNNDKSWSRIDEASTSGASSMIDESSICGNSTEYNQFKLTEIEFNRFIKIIENLIYITTIGDEFNRSLNQLSRCQSIGVTGLGIGNGDSTDLSILALSTTNEIFIYDILRIKSLDRLKIILESPYVTKIFHNGKLLYKHLRKYYHIKINNIFDTQVADSMISTRDESKDVTRTLSECLVYRYNLPELFDDEQVRYDNPIWYQRPLVRSDRRLIGYLVAFLRKLRNDLQNLLLKDLHNSIQNNYGEYIKKTDFDLVFTKETSRRSK